MFLILHLPEQVFVKSFLLSLMTTVSLRKLIPISAAGSKFLWSMPLPLLIPLDQKTKASLLQQGHPAIYLLLIITTNYQ